MPLARLAIKQPIFITMILLAITLVGVLSYLSMGVELYPNISAPVVMVSVSFPGASPQDVETLVTKPLERQLATVSGVDTISSTSNLGSSRVMISFVTGYDLQQGAQQVRERLDSVERLLPSGTGSPTLNRMDPSQMPFMSAILNVSGDPSPIELQQLIEQVIEPRLTQTTGIAAVTVRGYPVQNIEVNLIAGKLKALHVSPSEVISALNAENVIVPSGSLSASEQYVSVRTSAQFQTLDEMGKIVVARNNSRNILLQDVATISAETEDDTSLIRYNGERAMVVQLQMVSGGNVVETAKLTREKLDSLSQSFPSLHFTIFSDNSTFIEESNNDVMVTLVIGAALACLIVFLFIRNVRNTLITIAGLPIIILGTFAVISLLGYTRNIITLMALSICIGLLIDDAIVVRENIFRHMEKGAAPREAADKGTSEIAFAVIAITLTVVAFFIPVAFTGGMTGTIFKEFGVTVAVAVLISLFEAFTFAPLLTAYFSKPLKVAHKETGTKHANRFINFWISFLPAMNRSYRSILAWSLRFRWVVVGVSLALLAVSLLILGGMPMGFFPATDAGQISVGIGLQPGTSLEKTDRVAREVEQAILAMPEVESVYASIGSSTTPYQGSMSVNLKEGVVTDNVISRLRTAFPQYAGRIFFSKPNQFLGVGGGMMGGGVSMRGRPVQITVQGPVSMESLDEVAQDIMTRISTIPGVRDVGTSLPPQVPQLNIEVNRQRCADAGVSAATVGSTVSTLLQGSTATHIEWEGQRTDVIVALQDEDIKDPSSIMDMTVKGTGGTAYPLSRLVDIRSGTGATELTRENQQAQILVGANLEGRTSGEVTPDIEKALADMEVPAGISWQFSGMQANAGSAYSTMIMAFLLGMVFVYMMLASQFASFIHPFSVMVALPLAIIGSALAIWVTHSELTLIYMIGMILMMGVATKNSILLVDFIIRYRREGRGRTEAVLEAGPVRLRPILMTSLAIITGMLPTAFAMGAAGEFRAPMAIAVIGGVFTSTLLSLVVVPVVYTIIDDIMELVLRLFGVRRVSVQTSPSYELKDTGIQNGNGLTVSNGLSRRPSRWKWWKRQGK
ncbi:MAG: efflux RND transporter permease subunit [Dehalococcoidales bacterium]|nr:efflux RND transporter permease subunit [Dehalococcoidales bacterium]